MHIPTLLVKDSITKQTTSQVFSNKNKGSLLYKTFFPPTNPNLTPPDDNYNYPPPRWTFNNITNTQIHKAIDKMKPYKATMSGTISNSIFIHAKDLLVLYIGPLFRATHTLKFYPKEWALTKTLVLKKPGKPDYTIPGAWHPVILSNSLAHLLNGCLVLDVVTMCKTLNLLPANHFRVRPGCTTTDSIHLLTKTVKDSWRKNQVTSALLLDIKSTFPSIDIARLVHNMRKRGIPELYTEWLTRWFKDRQTNLVFDGFQLG